MSLHVFSTLSHEPDLTETPFIRLTDCLTPQDRALWDEMLDGLPRCTPQGPWIAGGAVRRFLEDLPRADVDYFFTCEAQHRTYRALMDAQYPRVLSHDAHHVTYQVGSVLLRTRIFPFA